MNETTKPITVAREDFKKDLLALCNSSGLPLFCIADILKTFIQQVEIASIEQYNKDKETYENIKSKNEKE